jgi:hypothetical protein
MMAKSAAWEISQHRASNLANHEMVSIFASISEDHMMLPWQILITPLHVKRVIA